VQGEVAEQKQSASTVTMARTGGVWSVSQTGEYTVDPTTVKFEFTGYKPGGQHIGTFNTMNATVGLDAEGNPINASLSMDVSSVKTDSEQLDKHLQTADFFDSAVNPKIDVKINSINMTGDTSAQAVTEISMKGVTKTVSVPVTFAKTSKGTKFMFDTRVVIGDFSIAYGPVLNEVRVTGEGEIVKK
jgi:polyisoprenoid-binding protein YceI